MRNPAYNPPEPFETPPAEWVGRICGAEIFGGRFVCDLPPDHPGLCGTGYGPDYPLERIPREDEGWTDPVAEAFLLANDPEAL